jgi:hypothetical protein
MQYTVYFNITERPILTYGVQGDVAEKFNRYDFPERTFPNNKRFERRRENKIKKFAQCLLMSKAKAM